VVCLIEWLFDETRLHFCLAYQQEEKINSLLTFKTLLGNFATDQRRHLSFCVRTVRPYDALHDGWSLRRCVVRKNATRLDFLHENRRALDSSYYLVSTFDLAKNGCNVAKFPLVWFTYFYVICDTTTKIWLCSFGVFWMTLTLRQLLHGVSSFFPSGLEVFTPRHCITLLWKFYFDVTTL